MQIKVVRHSDDFVLVPRQLVRQCPSLKAIGLYALISEVAAEQGCSVEELAEASGTGLRQIKTAIKELEESGFLERRKKFNNGRFAGMQYILKGQ